MGKKAFHSGICDPYWSGIRWNIPDKKIAVPQCNVGVHSFQDSISHVGTPWWAFRIYAVFFFLLSLSLNLLFLSSCSYSISCLRFLSSRHGILHKPSASAKFWPKSYHKSNMIFDIFHIANYA